MKMVKINQMIVLESDKERNLYDKVIIEKKRPKSFFLSKNRNYGMIKCDNIMTYFVDNFMFSQLTSPLLREKDAQINLAP